MSDLASLRVQNAVLQQDAKLTRASDLDLPQAARQTSGPAGGGEYFAQMPAEQSIQAPAYLLHASQGSKSAESSQSLGKPRHFFGRG